MRVLVAMSGGVDSSVAALLTREAGHEVVGVTLRLWGGPADRGCCSVADVDDARRVADRIGVDHHVFDFADEFERHVVTPYVTDHAVGRTPNPCIECNRHLKFDLLVERATALGFDAVATGHHARVVHRADGTRRIGRGRDAAKDQSYVLHMITGDVLRRLLFPVGDRTKDEVRAIAAAAGLRTATKPDSQDVCFIAGDGGRRTFLGDRIPLRPGRVVDLDGRPVGAVDALELVTLGQRRGLGLAGAASGRYVVDVDVAAATVVVGPLEATLVPELVVGDPIWVDGPPMGNVAVLVQTSAHGRPAAARVEPHPDGVVVRWEEPQRRVAPGQSVVWYDPAAPDEVLGGGSAR
jgi:tRNA-specific 2-thiouridylase